MRSADLDRPFHGARSVKRSTPAASVLDAVVLQCAAFTPLLASRQFFSHTTAALLWGCPLPVESEPPLPLHVTSFGSARGTERKKIVGHRATSGRVVVRLGFPVADPVTLFCQLAAILTLDDLVAVADHLVLDPAVLDPRDLRPYVLPEALRAGVDAFTGRGCRAARSAIGLVRPGAESRRETLLRLLLWRAGLPEPEVNPDIYSDAGHWLGRVDLMYREWKVIVEYDGDQHRTNTAQYEEDIARIERLERAGWLVVKVRARGLTVGRADTIRRVEDALAGRGWRR